MKKINPSRAGDLAEHYAVTWLWDNGYEVFKNAGCSGPVDLIGIKEGITYFFDIKSKSSQLDWGFTRTKKQKKLGVQILEFNPISRKMRFVEHRE